MAQAVERRFTTAGMIGTLLVAAVVLVCVRLGFWQLERRDERLALNARIAERQQLPPLASLSSLTDTAQSLYRIAAFPGHYDVARSIVLPGRSLRGVPGVHLLTPFLVAGDAAVLVNRGWVSAADGATIPLDSFPVGDRAVRGLVLPFPGFGASLSPRQRAPGDSFRTVWYTIDAEALRAQYPYALLPVVVQLLPEADAPRAPRRLEPPPLDQGPHLSYAIQWFSFALIGILGWLALYRRSRRPRSSIRVPEPPALALLLCALAAAPASAQLRPAEPLDWRIFDRETQLVMSAGSGVLLEQGATIAGSRGTLAELGTYRLLWRSGRAGIDFGGTAVWRFREDTILRERAEGVDEARNGTRMDAGPLTVAAIVRLTPEHWRTDVALRFGTRIPTTSDESGLERDRTDFLATLGARWRYHGFSAMGETGVGINGTRDHEYPQSDVWSFALRLQQQVSHYAVFAGINGHQDGHSWTPPRGNEDQAEAHGGVRVGRRWWAQGVYIHGWRGPAPNHGLQLSAGVQLGCRSDCLPF